MTGPYCQLLEVLALISRLIREVTTLSLLLLFLQGALAAARGTYFISLSPPPNTWAVPCHFHICPTVTERRTAQHFFLVTYNKCIPFDTPSPTSRISTHIWSSHQETLWLRKPVCPRSLEHLAPTSLPKPPRHIAYTEATFLHKATFFKTEGDSYFVYFYKQT